MARASGGGSAFPKRWEDVKRALARSDLATSELPQRTHVSRFGHDIMSGPRLDGGRTPKASSHLRCVASGHLIREGFRGRRTAPCQRCLRRSLNLTDNSNPRQTPTTTHKEVSHGVPGWVCLVFPGCHLVF